MLFLSLKRTPLPLCLPGYELPPLPTVSSLLRWRAFPQTRSQDKSLTLVLVLLGVCYGVEKCRTTGKSQTEPAWNEAHKTTRFIFWFVKVTLVVVTEESSEENMNIDVYQLPITIFQVTQNLVP